MFVDSTNEDGHVWCIAILSTSWPNNDISHFTTFSKSPWVLHIIYFWKGKVRNANSCGIPSVTVQHDINYIYLMWAHDRTKQDLGSTMLESNGKINGDWLAWGHSALNGYNFWLINVPFTFKCLFSWYVILNFPVSNLYCWCWWPSAWATMLNRRWNKLPIMLLFEYLCLNWTLAELLEVWWQNMIL